MDSVQTRERESTQLEGLPRSVGGTSTFAMSERGQQGSKSAEIVAGGSMAEAIAGVAAVVLAIVGLAGVYPNYLAPIAAIAVGAGFFLQGCSVAARMSSLLRQIGDTGATEAELGGGMSGELLGGVAGIALGILALVGVAPLVLLSVSAIVFGGTLMVAAAGNRSLNYLRIEQWSHHPQAQRLAGDLVATANGAQVLVGLGAIALGIIALTGTVPMTLCLVTFLAVGGAALLSGASVGGKMFSMLSRG